MLLVDTSVWVDHLRRGNGRLIAALEDHDVVTHPFIIGELACGDLRDRRSVLGLIDRLPKATVATDVEARTLIEEHRLMGRGLGFIDVHLLAATLLSTSVRLWTLDAPLATTAQRLGIAAA